MTLPSIRHASDPLDAALTEYEDALLKHAPVTAAADVRGHIEAARSAIREAAHVAGVVPRGPVLTSGYAREVA